MPKDIMLETVQVKGFLSIREAEIPFRALNVLIGANGSGKSNLITLFQMLNRMAVGELKNYILKAGGANTLLHYGRKQTDRMKIRIQFKRKNELANAYSCELIPTQADTLAIAQERIEFHDQDRFSTPYKLGMPGTYQESALTKPELWGDDNRDKGIARHVRDCLLAYRVYHFHDTSVGAWVKQFGYLHDNNFLQEDGSNLAAYLYRMREKEEQCYQRVVETVRLTNPYFGDFVLSPSQLNPEQIRLEWREKLSDTVFSPHALSDGTLRFICLATLLMQPPKLMPALILLDEPELGLHPFAIRLLAEMMSTASQHTQIITATQSPLLVSWFEPEDLLVVERVQSSSQFRRLDRQDIAGWLEDYSLGEIWEKNLIGGRPSL